MTTMREAGAVAVLLPGYTCRCARCEYAWASRCDCPVVAPEAGVGAPIHLAECRPPTRCPGCKANGWHLPAAWAPGEGTSRESIRRRNVAKRKRRRGRGRV